MANRAGVVRKDPVLRTLLLEIPEKSWYNACQIFWEISQEKLPAKSSIQDDVRQRLHWVRTPNRESVGKLPKMLLSFVKVAVTHLKSEGLRDDSRIPDSSEQWTTLLDDIATHLGDDFVKFCYLAAPAVVDWNVPETSTSADASTHQVADTKDRPLTSIPLKTSVNDATPESAGADMHARSTSSELIDLLDEVRTAGSAVLDALTTVSDSIDDTQFIEEDLDELVALVNGWNSALTQFAQGLYGHEKSIAGGLDSLTAEVDRVSDEENYQAEQYELLEEHNRKLDQFEETRKSSLYAEDDEYRKLVDQRITALTLEIAELESIIETSRYTLRGPDVIDPAQIELDLGMDAAPREDEHRSALEENDQNSTSEVVIEDLAKEESESCDVQNSAGNSDAAPDSEASAGAGIGVDGQETPNNFADAKTTESGNDGTELGIHNGQVASPEIFKRSVAQVDDIIRDPEPIAQPSQSGATRSSTVDTEQEGVQHDQVIGQDLATLILGNRWAAASAIAPATSIDIATIQALDFCSEAFSLSIISTDPHEMLGRNTTVISTALQSPSTDAALLTVIGILRTCLQFGREQYWQLTDESFDSLPGNWREIGRALRDAVADGYQHRWENLTTHDTSIPPTLLKREAEALRRTLPKRSNKFQRAGSVLKYMLNPGGELGSALDTVIMWADGVEDVDTIQNARMALSDPRKLIDRTDAALHKTKQKKAPIVSNAYDNLVGRIGEVTQLLDRAIAVAELGTNQSHADGPHTDAARELIQNLPHVDLDGKLRAAVLDRFRAWLVSGEGPAADVSRAFHQLKFTSSLPAVSAIRDENHDLPVKSNVEGLVLTHELLHPKSESDLFHAYLERGNLIAAGEIRNDSDSMLALRTAQRDWRHQIEARIVDLQTDLLRMQAQTQIDPVERAKIDGRISGLTTSLDDRFDIVIVRVDEITTELARLWEKGRNLLLSSLSELDLAIGIRLEDLERITALIDQNDFITAREFVAILSNGKGRSLPPMEDSGLVELLRFHDILNSWQKSSTNALEIAQELFDGEVLPERTVTALKAWNQGQRARKPSEWQRLLPSLLSLLGLEKIPQIPIMDNTDRGRRLGKFIVKATPNGGSYVAALGSRTRRKGYTVYIVPPEKTVESSFETIPVGERREANLIFFPGALSWDERKKIRAAAEKKKITALVIDTPTIVYMAAWGENRFSSLQRISLPFSIFPHWAPRVAGDVPDELFVGREEEIDKIISRDGSIFVYGGRQLGKSALLHRIERDFNKMDNKLAIYIDFKVERIGEENEPEYLWTVLRNRLQDEGIVPANNNSTKSEAIAKKIRDWLDADPDRRILLLCDETDAFLQNEARERMVDNRPVSFPNLAVVKGLMDATHRRFKPVFAGLHQVQRIADTPNSPLAHGGEDILVGPLNAQEAWDLVVRPFKALGYQFDTLDMVWRLLAFTNHHAGLVQIVCDELYKYLRARRITATEPPFVISTEDVDHVITSKNVRDFIAERFRLTIQLEDRYFVVAMVIALLGLDSDFKNRYPQSEILEHCRLYWPGGFDALGEDELSVYLDEMVGLGVLVRASEKYYGMRSPNVVHMLGDRETIENQLLGGRFELPLQYNARVSRRRLSASRGIEKYSPLTEHELSRVMPKRIGTGRDQYTFAVIGSTALGIGSVQELLSAASKEDDEYGLELVPAEDSKELVRAGAGAPSRRPLVVCNATDDSEYVKEVIDRIGAAQATNIGRRGVLLGASGASARRNLATMGVEVVPLQLWTVETVRATIDNPITDPAQREEFVKASGGWPILCERYLDRIRTGTAVTDIVNRVAEFPSTADEAVSFLSDTGLTDAEDLALLVSWSEIAEEGDVIDSRTLSELLAVSDDSLSILIDRLSILSIVSEHTEGVVLNNVVHRSLKAVGDTDAK